jgi:Tfp pilus assembly protein PilP
MFLLENFMTATKTVNYTAEQEATITAMAGAGKLTSADAEKLAEQFSKTVKSVVAKLSRMGVYKAKEYTTKTGAAPVTKSVHAEAIGAILRLPLNDIDSLEKCTKNALHTIFEALANSKPIED